MYRGNTTKIIPSIIAILLVIGALVGLFFIGKALFFGDSTASIEDDPGRAALTQTTSEMSVRMTVRGPIVANEEFRSYQAEVSPSGRALTTYSGYIAAQLEQQALSNNVPAYREFVAALERNKFMNARELNSESNNTDGICASGTLYKFEVLNSGQPVKTLWKTTCGNGSFSANIATIKKLFLLQFPDSSKLLDKVDLSS